jgi:rhomboid protease GluP
VIGRLYLRAVHAGITLLEALGARGTRWEWRKRIWLQAAEEKVAAWENVGRGVRTTLRMCRSCRTLVEGGASTCPACGASMRDVPKGGVVRGLGLLFPGRPSVSIILLTVNALLLLVTVGLDQGGISSLLHPTNQTLWLLGAKQTAWIFTLGEWWRLITANYLHGGIIHLFFNSMALATLGPLIEEGFGARRLFVIYTLSGISGFLLSAWFGRGPGVVSIGASGAIYGLLGFAVVYGRWRAGAGARALADQLTQWLLYGVFMFFIPGIDNLAHVGGLLLGAGLGLVLDPGDPRTRARNLLLWLLFFLCLGLTFWSFAAMIRSYPAHVEWLKTHP